MEPMTPKTDPSFIVRLRAPLPLAAALAGALALVSSCGGDEASGGGPGDPAMGAPSATPREPAYDFSQAGGISDADLSSFHAILAFESGGVGLGSIQVEVWPESAPAAARRFLRLCDEGWYDGTGVPRIMREYILQAGDASAGGVRESSYGALPPEVSMDPAHSHHYGVLGMAAPPRSQFYICLAESTPVWSLDTQGFSAFGKVAGGVSVLESVANLEVGFAGEERSYPIEPVVISRATVVQGEVSRDEPILRPRPDLAGQPERVSIRPILVTFLERGKGLGITRDRRAAFERATECFDRLKSGELDFDQARLLYSDRQYPADFIPPPWKISNYGVYDPGQHARQDSLRELAAYRAELSALVSAGELTSPEMAEMFNARSQESALWVRENSLERREEISAPGFASVAFELEVGEVGFVPFDPYECPQGFYVIQRID